MKDICKREWDRAIDRYYELAWRDPINREWGRTQSQRYLAHIQAVSDDPEATKKDQVRGGWRAMGLLILLGASILVTELVLLEVLDVLGLLWTFGAD